MPPCDAQHLDHRIDELVACGMPPQRAREQAHREFGNQTRIREEIYEMNSIPVLEPLLRDLRYAARTLRKSPGFTVTAVTTLALAIAINTAVFSIVDGVLLRPLPYREPDRLALLEARVEAAGLRDTRTSQHGAAWTVVRDHTTTVQPAVFSTWVSGVNVVAGDRAIHADQQKVGSGFFGVLGLQPLHGREFSPGEDRAGGPAAAMLSYEFWQSALAGDLAILGAPITLRGEPHTVVGIMPPRTQAGVKADLWTPLRPSTGGEGAGENYQILLRLKPEATRAAADAELFGLGAEINRLHPLAEGTTISYGTVPLQNGLTEGLRRPLLMLWAAVGIVLLIACVNLAGLMIARGARRQREIATRMALGSGRAAIVRQLLVESLVVGTTAAVLGVALGGLALDALKTLAENALDLWQPIAIDLRVSGAAALAALAATAAFGVVPALQSTRVTVQQGLASMGARTVAGAAPHLTRRLAVVTQVALGVMLLVGAGLLLRTFAHLRGLDPGFDGRGVYAGTVSLQDARYQTSEQVNALSTRVLARLGQTPGVQAAGVSLGLPYERLLNLGFRHLDGVEAEGDARISSATYVAGDYFRAIGIPLEAGRVFDERDSRASLPVALVNETTVREYFGGANPIGRRIRFAGADREIVGVVGDVQLRPGFGDRGPIAAMPLAYLPLAQAGDGLLRLVHGWFATSFVVRSQGGMDQAAPALRAALNGVDPMLPFADVRSIAEVRSAAVALPRLLGVLFVTLAAAAIVLASIGIYGLIASAVGERTREMGIRMALGASAARAVRTLAMPGIVLAVIGILVGAAAARAATTLVSSFVWGISPTDPATYAVVIALLVFVAALASLLPALRILRLDPARTLRAE